jgi:hypothetical protein
MLSKRKYYVLLSLSTLVYFVIAAYYSFQIPFGLIDDYGEWEKYIYFDSLQNLLNSLHEKFLSLSSSRFRPILDYSSSLLYKFFNRSPEIHHFFRVLLKLLTLMFGLKVLNELKVRNCFLLLFSILFLFSPNMPEIRLAPVELYFGLFLYTSIFFLFRQYDNESKYSNLILLLISVTLLSLSKEFGVLFFFGIPLLLFKNKFIINFTRHKKKSCFLALSWLCLSCYFVVVVYFASTGGYVSGQKNIDLVKLASANYYYLFGFMPFNIINWVLALTSVYSLFHIRKMGFKTWKVIVLIITILLLFLISFKFPYVCMRYYYPLQLVFFLLGTYTLSYIYETYNLGSRRVNLILILLGLLHIYMSFPNILNQYRYHVAARTRESELLEFLRKKVLENENISIIGNSEFESKIYIYLTKYIRKVYGISGVNVYKSSSVECLGSSGYVVSQKETIANSIEVYSSLNTIVACRSKSIPCGGNRVHDCGAPLNCNMRTWRVFKCQK